MNYSTLKCLLRSEIYVNTSNKQNVLDQKLNRYNEYALISFKGLE